jgi:hypothetical protein
VLAGTYIATIWIFINFFYNYFYFIKFYKSVITRRLEKYSALGWRLEWLSGLLLAFDSWGTLWLYCCSNYYFLYYFFLSTNSKLVYFKKCIYFFQNKKKSYLDLLDELKKEIRLNTVIAEPNDKRILKIIQVFGALKKYILYILIIVYLIVFFWKKNNYCILESKRSKRSKRSKSRQ